MINYKPSLYLYYFIVVFSFYNYVHSRSIHVFGDSHSAACFSNLAQNITFHHREINYYNPIFNFSLYVHYLLGRTMYRIGRDGLDLKKWNIKKGDIVIFIFGEIDVRCHILKQVDLYKRDLHIIISNLVDSYINAITNNQPDLTYMVLGVIPPTENDEKLKNPRFPYWGKASERVKVNHSLNKSLAKSCKRKNILFCPFPQEFATVEGILKKDLSDANVHIGSKYRPIVQRACYNILSLAKKI